MRFRERRHSLLSTQGWGSHRSKDTYLVSAQDWGSHKSEDSVLQDHHGLNWSLITDHWYLITFTSLLVQGPNHVISLRLLLQAAVLCSPAKTMTSAKGSKHFHCNFMAPQADVFQWGGLLADREFLTIIARCTLLKVSSKRPTYASEEGLEQIESKLLDIHFWWLHRADSTTIWVLLAKDMLEHWAKGEEPSCQPFLVKLAAIQQGLRNQGLRSDNSSRPNLGCRTLFKLLPLGFSWGSSNLQTSC